MGFSNKQACDPLLIILHDRIYQKPVGVAVVSTIYSMYWMVQDFYHQQYLG